MKEPAGPPPATPNPEGALPVAGPDATADSVEALEFSAVTEPELALGAETGRDPLAGATTPELELHPDRPVTFAQYRLRRLLGEGGMGNVYEAEEPGLNRRVALKVMRPEFARDGDARQRFLREARLLAGLQSDYVISVFQVGEAEGLPYLAMPLLRGVSLQAYLDGGKTFTLAQAMRLGRQVALGLAAAHAQGLIHRDVKPANLFLTAPRGRVKILDFGLARREGEQRHLTQVGHIVGTPGYMAPEQATGQAVDARADLFSMGVVLYRLTTGRLPYDGPNPLSQLMALATRPPKPPRNLNPALPPAVEALILRLLARDPGQRPASAAAVAEALQRLEGRLAAPAAAARPRFTRSTGSAPVAVVGSGPRRRALRPWQAAGAAVALAVLAAAGGFVAFSALAPRPEAERPAAAVPPPAPAPARTPAPPPAVRRAAEADGFDLRWRDDFERPALPGWLRLGSAGDEEANRRDPSRARAGDTSLRLRGDGDLPAEVRCRLPAVPRPFYLRLGIARGPQPLRPEAAHAYRHRIALLRLDGLADAPAEAVEVARVTADQIQGPGGGKYPLPAGRWATVLARVEADAVTWWAEGAYLGRAPLPPGDVRAPFNALSLACGSGDAWFDDMQLLTDRDDADDRAAVAAWSSAMRTLETQPGPAARQQLASFAARYGASGVAKYQALAAAARAVAADR